MGENKVDDAYRHGREEADDLLKYEPNPNYTAEEVEAYRSGYLVRMTYMVDSGAVTVNRARELMGNAPAEEEKALKDIMQKALDHELNPVTNDPVKVPSHYTSGQIEVANFISDQKLDWTRGSVIKYVSRAGKKDPEKELEDLEKAAAFLQMAYNLANGLPAIVRDPETNEVVWSLFSKPKKNWQDAMSDMAQVAYLRESSKAE